MSTHWVSGDRYYSECYTSICIWAYSYWKRVQACPGRGQRRIFAIGKIVMPRPFHDWYMKALRSIRMDGTFNLSKVSHRVKDSLLSAATDRFPLRLMFYVAEALRCGEPPSSGQQLSCRFCLRRSPPPPFSFGLEELSEGCIPGSIEIVERGGSVRVS